MGWFLLRLVDLFDAYSLHIISRNHSTFLLINLQELKFVESKILQKYVIYQKKLLSFTEPYFEKLHVSNFAFFLSLKTNLAKNKSHKVRITVVNFDIDFIIFDSKF